MFSNLGFYDFSRSEPVPGFASSGTTEDVTTRRTWQMWQCCKRKVIQHIYSYCRRGFLKPVFVAFGSSMCSQCIQVI